MMGHSSVVYQPFKRLKMALKSKKRNRSSITMGVATTLLASLSFTFMSACAKWLPEMPSGEMTLFRGIVGLFFIPLLCLQTKEHFFSDSFAVGSFLYVPSVTAFFERKITSSGDSRDARHCGGDTLRGANLEF